MPPLSIPSHPLSAACAYAALGWRVFPCRADKRPATRSGFKDATTDADQIRTWWVDNPDYLIGIATGSGLLVIDNDSYKNDGKMEEWQAFLSAHGGLPTTYTVRSGSGGVHSYFTITEEIRSTTGAFPGIDVRADGGYVIAPPSVSESGAYVVVDPSPLAAAPEWLLVPLRKEPAPDLASDLVPVPDLSEEEQARCNQYAARVFELETDRLRECARLAVSSGNWYKGQPWNVTTFEVACNLLEITNSGWNSLTEADAYEAVKGAAPRDSGFGSAQIVSCWNSARKTVGSKVRALPSLGGGGMFFSYPDMKGPVDPASFFVPKEGLDTVRLAAAVMELGPLAIETGADRGTWRYSAGVWVEAGNEIMNRCTVLLGSRFRLNHVSTVTPMVLRILEENGSIITCEPVSDYVNVRNGMLHWSTGTLYPHDPSFYSTVQLPIEWDAAAVCPQFDTFVGEVMPPDAISYLWEIIGYLCYSGNPLQRAFLFHGRGANGKGTLIRVLIGLLGAHNVSAVTLADMTEARFEIASLFGKIANLAGDIDATYQRSTAKLKAVTGEDKIRAERKYENGFSFQCWAVPVFSANEFWKSADTTQGHFRRWQIVPFPNTFTVKDGQGLTERLCSELPGILVSAVAALRQLMDRGEFDTPKSALHEKEKFTLAADQVAEWLEEDAAIVRAIPGDRSVHYPVADAYRRYRVWAEENGNGALPSSKWWMRMESLGWTRRKSKIRIIDGLLIDVKLALVTPNRSYVN